MTTATARPPAPEPRPDPGVRLLVVRCPRHRRERRPGRKNTTSPTVRCGQCRVVWADGEGPEAARQRERERHDHGEITQPPRRWDAAPPV